MRRPLQPGARSRCPASQATEPSTGRAPLRLQPASARVRQAGVASLTLGDHPTALPSPGWCSEACGRARPDARPRHLRLCGLWEYQAPRFREVRPDWLPGCHTTRAEARSQAGARETLASPSSTMRSSPTSPCGMRSRTPRNRPRSCLEVCCWRPGPWAMPGATGTESMETLAGSGAQLDDTVGTRTEESRPPCAPQRHTVGRVRNRGRRHS